VADLKVTTNGLNVHVDGTGSYDADGDALEYYIAFGGKDFANNGADATFFTYKEAWHTYTEPGDYTIRLTVADGKGGYVTKFQLISVAATSGNQAPKARLTFQQKVGTLEVFGASSYDPDATSLTFEWDFGDGRISHDSNTSITNCTGDEGTVDVDLVTLMVSDGELKETAQISLGRSCLILIPVKEIPYAQFVYSVKDRSVFVDASASAREINFSWNFGDGTTGVGLMASHTYASPGAYNITLNVEGLNREVASEVQTVVVGSNSSVASTSSSVTTSSRTSSSVISRSSSSISSSSSQGSSDRNRYTAPRATTAPIIDGVVDSVWDRASWAPINVFWLGTQSNPSAQDYSGRYKALWDENYLYVLYDITDDRIYDGVRDALDRYWEDDTVELFIDENKNGGQHGYNTSAWAYHISTYGDVVDSTTGGAKLLNDHIDSRLVSNGTQHYWELRVRIYGEDYADWKSNTPLQLYAGKLMGFSACYIDNDGSSQRESMMGSVDTQGHKNNQGYLDASVFGSLLLVE